MLPISPMCIYGFQRLRHEVAPAAAVPRTETEPARQEDFTGLLYC